MKRPTNERDALSLLAERLEGNSEEGLGPGLLDDYGVRMAFLESWWRAWRGSKEDIRAMVKIGEALMALKKRKPRSDDALGERIIEGRFRRLDELVPRGEKDAERFRDRVFVGAESVRAREKGRADDEGVLMWLFGRPEALDVLLEARAHPPARGPLPYRRMARAFVRPVESPEDAKKAIRRERRRRARRKP